MLNEEISKYGWRHKLNYIFPEKRIQKLNATRMQIIEMLPLSLRYMWYLIKKWMAGRKPVMDFIFLEQSKQFSGVPLGGIGGGTIGRSFKGDFYNYQMQPGIADQNLAKATSFILTVQNQQRETLYQTVLTGEKRSNKILSKWQWKLNTEDVEYTALYPRSWTQYDIKDQNLTLVCKQISPVIPHNYKDSSIPGGVFEWVILNNSGNPKYISITFTMNSATQCTHSGYVSCETFTRNNDTTKTSGLMMNECNQYGRYTLAIAALENDKVRVTKCPYFDPCGNGEDIWDPLERYGEFKNGSPNSADMAKMGCAVCCNLLVGDKQREVTSFCLAWDMPSIKFPNGKQAMKRYYTKFFSNSGKIAPELCLYCLGNYQSWQTAIEDWQKDILESGLPDWYKSAIFNELYYITNGGTIWLLLDEMQCLGLPHHDPRIQYGRFGYLEGLEYRMYNTYDVHFYGSFALIMLWPKLQLSLQYDLNEVISYEDKTMIWYLYNGVRGFRKTKDTVPHDLGDPDEAPYDLINSYPVHDVSKWRDLNLKFVLQVYRDYMVALNDKQYLEDMFGNITAVMRRSLEWDLDGDGMIENSGTPDQTYDAWIMDGTSAYCGGLWLAALAVYLEIAKILNEISIIQEFSQILDKAKVAFERKLWTGAYYRFDSSGGAHSDSIMADQLCGLWYLHCCKCSDQIFSAAKVKQALGTIFKYNVCSYYDGAQGAVNGMFPDCRIDRSSVQSEEVWTGVGYALASLLYFEDMKQEAFKTAEGIYETVYEKSGLGFATPEALIGPRSFRSLSYMRPLSIWSLQLAIQHKA